MDPEPETDLSNIPNVAFAEVRSMQKTLDSLGEQTVKMIQVEGQAEITNQIDRYVVHSSQ